MSIIKHNYELSVWSLAGKEEKKIATIGSSSMTNQARAQEVSLKRNINGTKELNFYLHTSFLDPQEGVMKDNPFYPLLSNNTRLKLYWKNNWYEFNIKSIVEDSNNKKVTYVAEDAFIKELSKRGFNVELSTELENNQGSAFDLGDSILKDSGWIINREESQIKPQFVEDSLVELMIGEDFFIADKKIIIDANEMIQISCGKFLIPKRKKVLGFYNDLINERPMFQFYYLEDENYVANDSNFIINCPLYIVENQQYDEQTPLGMKKEKISSFQGKRLIKAQKTGYNHLLQKYVNYYEDSDGTEITGYTETEYLTTDSVSNLVTNGKDFSGETGWLSVDNSETISARSYPDDSSALEMINEEKLVNLKYYLSLEFSNFDLWQYYNTGISDNKFILKSLQKGQKFVVRIKYGFLKSKNLKKYPNEPYYDKDTLIPHSCFKIGLCSYSYDGNGAPVIETELFSTTLEKGKENGFKRDKDGYFSAICTNNTTLSETELEEKNLGFFFALEKTKRSSLTEENLSDYTYFIEDCQIFQFKEKDDNSGEYYTPDDLIDGITKKIYNYFYTNSSYENAEEIEYIYRGYKEQPYKSLYYDDYRQIRTIEAKESNYFNLIQNLCETFECWADFRVKHDSLGYILKDKQNNYIKEVILKPYTGKENWAGFHQGINLKNIVRTLDSSGITTKTIVKPNNNEFAPNGFCTIAYAEDNPSGESFIYDFSYYEEKGLIDRESLNTYLYNSFYPNLKKYNNKLLQLSEDNTNISLELIHLNSNLEVKKALCSELATEINNSKKDFKIYCGLNYLDFLELEKGAQEDFLELSGTSESFITIVRDTEKLKTTQQEVVELENKIKEVKEKKQEIVDEMQFLTFSKQEEILNFENKYSSFIHEGVWISEDYIDHNTYYVDAKNVAATSAKPQVTYNIEVIDLSCIEEFLSYNFDIGDKTYIIDTEFFGYVFKDTIATPRQKEVIITELIEFLDSPENNKITVQNYKTQFEDLFQRITATAQQLQLREGEYSRAASAFNSTGLNQQITQDSLNTSDDFYLKNNSNAWDSEGFVSTNLTNNREFLKIHNGSLFLTSDGGKNWGAVLNGSGINASYIYGGQIDAGKINIVSELKTDEKGKLEYALTLDKDGLSMYSYKNKKVPRIRLGKIYSNDVYNEELYGLQLYDAEGKQTFKTDSDGNITMKGTIYAKDGSFSGTISASKGLIGGWIIDTNNLIHKKNGATDAIISTEKLGSNYTVNSYSTNDWRMIFGIYGIGGKFGVTGSGNLYANGVDIKDGNISFGDIFKVTSNKTESDNGTNLGYGLNIQFTSENQDKEVVIESDDRIIGIREKVLDANGNSVYDENGNQKWVWKTVLGDLTKVTIGKDSLSGYGLCTENGYFSGTIASAKGKIGNWKIIENKFLIDFDEDKNDSETINNGVIIGGIKKEEEEEFSYSLVLKEEEKEEEESASFYKAICSYGGSGKEIQKGTLYEIFPNEEFEFFDEFSIFETDGNGETVSVTGITPHDLFLPKISNIEQIKNSKIKFEWVDNYYISHTTELSIDKNDIILDTPIEFSLSTAEMLGDTGLKVTLGLKETLKNTICNKIEEEKEEGLTSTSIRIKQIIFEIESDINPYGTYNGPISIWEERDTFKYRCSGNSEGLTGLKDFFTYQFFKVRKANLATPVAVAIILSSLKTKYNNNRAYYLKVLKNGENVFGLTQDGTFYTEVFHTKEEERIGFPALNEIKHCVYLDKDYLGKDKGAQIDQLTLFKINTYQNNELTDGVAAFELSKETCISENIKTESLLINSIFTPDGEVFGGQWVFEIGQKDEKEIQSFYSTTKSNLGTEEHPWEKAYIKKLMIKNETSFKDSDNLLYAKKGNDSEVGGIYYEIDIANLDYFRIPKKGILPYYRYNKVPNNETNSTIGTANWYFENGYFNKITIGGKEYSEFPSGLDNLLKAKTDTGVGGSYWGISFLDNDKEIEYLRVPSKGLLPYYRTEEAKNAGVTNSNLGSSYWRFNVGYFENLNTGGHTYFYQRGNTVTITNLYTTGYISPDDTNNTTVNFSIYLDRIIPSTLRKAEEIIIDEITKQNFYICSSGNYQFTKDTGFSDPNRAGIGSIAINYVGPNYISFILKANSATSGTSARGVSAGISINSFTFSFKSEENLTLE